MQRVNMNHPWMQGTPRASLLAELADDRAWPSHEDTFVTWRREPWARTPSFRAQSVIYAPAAQVASLLREVDLCEPSGVAVARHRVLVLASDPQSTRQAFFVNSVGGLLRDRCYSVECRARRTAEGTFVLMWYSVPPLPVIESEEVRAVWGDVRFHGCHVQALSPTRARLRRIVNVDARFDVPAWIAEQVFRMSHNRVCSRAATFRGPEAERRVKADPFSRAPLSRASIAPRPSLIPH